MYYVVVLEGKRRGVMINIEIIKQFKCFLNDQVTWESFEKFVIDHIDMIQESLEASGDDNLYMELMVLPYEKLYARQHLRSLIEAYLTKHEIDYVRECRDDLEAAQNSKKYKLNPSTNMFV